MPENTAIRVGANISVQMHEIIRQKYPKREDLSFQSLVSILLQRWIDAGMPSPAEMMLESSTPDHATAAKLLAFYQSEDGGPAERGFRQILRDLIEDKL